MLTLEKYTGVNIGNIKSLEIILASFVNFIPDPDENHMVNFWDIEFDGPDLFEKIEFTKNTCSFSESQSDSDNGDVFNPEIKCQVAKSRTEATAFFRKFNGMYIYAKITDMDDNSILVGKVKLYKKREIQGSPSGKNVYEIEISGETTQEAVFLNFEQFDSIYDPDAICLLLNKPFDGNLHKLMFHVVGVDELVFNIEHNGTITNYTIDVSLYSNYPHTLDQVILPGSYLKITGDLQLLNYIYMAGLGITRFSLPDTNAVLNLLLDNNAITEVDDINNILIKLDATGITDGTCGLDGSDVDYGSNAAPTGAGITAMNNLINTKGWDIDVNP